MIVPYEGPNDESILAKMLKDEETTMRKIAVAKSKRRYLEHLRSEATNPQEQKICVICRESFEVGALTGKFVPVSICYLSLSLGAPRTRENSFILVSQHQTFL